MKISKHKHIFPKVIIEWSQMQKMTPCLICTKYINNWINHHRIIAKFLWQIVLNFFKLPAVTDWSVFLTMKTLIMIYELVHLLVLILNGMFTLYRCVVWPIKFDLTLDTNYSDESNESLIISMSLIWVFHYWNMNIFPTNIPWIYCDHHM